MTSNLFRAGHAIRLEISSSNFPRFDCNLNTGAPIGERMVVTGRIVDGDGRAVRRNLVEIWQADAGGHYHHPDDRGRAEADSAFTGFGRAATAGGGSFAFHTIKPGVVRGPDGQPQDGHVTLTKNFLDAIRGKADLFCGIEHGIRIQAIVSMAELSFRKSRTVTFDAQKRKMSV